MSTTARYLVALERQIQTTRQVVLDASDWPQRGASDREMRQHAVRRLQLATPVFVSREITALLEPARSTLPDGPLTAAEPAEEPAFVWFEGLDLPLGPHPDGGEQFLSAVSWGPALDTSSGKRGVALLGFGRWTLEHACEDPVHLIAASVWTYGTTIAAQARPSSVLTDRERARWRAEPGRALAELARSLWAFMQQRICVRQQVPPDRAMRRRLERDGGKPAPFIEVVDLRARDYVRGDADPERQPVDWSCRWLVRAHWRNQYCGPDRPHQRILVPVHVKGPPEKPLKTAAKLFAVVR